MGNFLGIDLGTSYFKVGIFNEKGKMIGLGRKSVKKFTGDGTICELSVIDFWDTINACVKEALQKADITSEEILSFSYSSQTNSFILLDENDNPLTPLILWPDRRAEETGLPVLDLQYKKDFMEKTGLGINLNSELAIAKIFWFQKKQTEIWKHVKSILSISDYLTFKLTGQKISDVSTASMTGLLDVLKCQWWSHALKSFYLNSELLPTLKRTGSFVGKITESGAQLIGLNADVSYYSGGFDHQCAAIGCGVTQSNNISESTGTVLACVSYSNEYSPGINRCTFPGLDNNHYFELSFNGNGAVSLEWYKENYAKEYSIPELLDLAKANKDGCEGLVARPSANKYEGLSGFENVKSCHKHGHFILALLESTANDLAGLVKLVKAPDFSGRIISTGGGAKSSLWVRIKSDRLSTIFNIPECNETACMGAAMIGAVGTGKCGDWNEITNNWIRFKEIVRPVSEKKNEFLK